MTNPDFEFLKMTLTDSRAVLAALPPRPEIKLDRTKLIQQISVPNGKSSCRLASILNGLIIRGDISTEIAKSMQETIVTHESFDSKWSGFGLEHLGLKGYRGYSDEVVDLASIASKTSIPKLVQPDLYHLSATEQIGVCLNLLASNHPLLVNEPYHTCLCVKHYEETNEVELVDPREPAWVRMETVSDFASRFEIGSCQIY